MFRSLSRITVAAVLVLAFLLSTVPAQAQPLNPGSSFTFDSSWLEAALGWLESLLGGGGSEGLQSMTTESTQSNGGGGRITIRTGPCIDPSGSDCYGG